METYVSFTDSAGVEMHINPHHVMMVRAVEGGCEVVLSNGQAPPMIPFPATKVAWDLRRGRP